MATHPAMSSRNRWVLAFVLIATPFVYAYVTSHWRNLHSPLQEALSFRSTALAYFLAIGDEAIGAGIAAAILGAPLAWFIRGRSLFLASCLAIAAAATLLPDLFLVVGSNFPLKYTLYMVPTLVMFYLLSWAVTAFVARRSRQPAA